MKKLNHTIEKYNLTGNPEIIAVDFDSTLSLGGAFPGVGEPNEPLFAILRKMQEQGSKIILWTCRGDESLKAAVEFMKANNLPPDAVNENILHLRGLGEAKVYADIYIDDRACLPESFIKQFSAEAG